MKMEKFIRVTLISMALILAWGSQISILAQGKRQTIGIGIRADDLIYLKERKKGTDVKLTLQSGEEKVGKLEAVNTDFLWVKEDWSLNKVTKIRFDGVSQVRFVRKSKPRGKRVLGDC